MSQENAAGPENGITGQANPESEESWRDIHLAGSELKDHPVLADVADIPALVRAYVDTKSYVGRKGVILPKEGDVKDHERFLKEIGRPETPDGYDITAPKDLPDGFPYVPELEAGYKRWSHEAGLRPEQAKFLFDKYLQANVEIFKAQEAKQTAEFAKDVEEMRATLQTKWGDKYAEKLTTARKALNRFAPMGSEAWTALDNAIGDDPRLAELFFNIGSVMGEGDDDGDFVAGRSPSSNSLEARRQELMASEAYISDRHPDHKRVVKEVFDIYNKQRPEIIEA